MIMGDSHESYSVEAGGGPAEVRTENSGQNHSCDAEHRESELLARGQGETGKSLGGSWNQFPGGWDNRKEFRAQGVGPRPEFLRPD